MIPEPGGFEFYSRTNVRITMDQWMTFMRNMAYKVVAVTDFGSTEETRCAVSTVWLGMHIPLHHREVPLIFETMVFAPGTELNDLQWRYGTIDQAIEGHDMLATGLRLELAEKGALRG